MQAAAPFATSSSHPLAGRASAREIRFRQRKLDPRDVTVVDGLPGMTVERAIVDLVEKVGDLPRPRRDPRRLGLGAGR